MPIQQSMPFLLLLVVISAGAGVAAGGPSSVITLTCSAVAKETHANTANAKKIYNDCVHTLSACPEAASAIDIRGVAIAAADLTVANVTNMEGFLQDLIGNLQSCLETYKRMRGTVTGGTENLRAGRLEAAVNKFTYADTMPEECFLPYMYAEKQSPIDEEITASLFPTSLASIILGLLKNGHKV